MHAANPFPVHSRADFIFKDSVLAPQAERPACPIDTSVSPSEPGATVVKAVGAVLWVQFEDGSTWGDAESGKQILSIRSRKLAFLQKLVAEYYDNGETSFMAMLNDRNLTHVFGRWRVVLWKMQNLKGFRQSIWRKTDWKLRKNGSHCSAPSSNRYSAILVFMLYTKFFNVLPIRDAQRSPAPRGLINCLNQCRFHSRDSMSSNSSSE
jgi:hypothetical protein